MEAETVDTIIIIVGVIATGVGLYCLFAGLISEWRIRSGGRRATPRRKARHRHRRTYAR